MKLDILFEDNHLLIINKPIGVLVQGDKTGDIPLVDLAKAYIKQKYNKPGAVFLGVVHRLDRPTSGAIVFTRTSNQKQNKSYAHKKETPESKKAILKYSIKKKLDNYSLLEIELETGRHHQIRAQLTAIGCPIKGDLKYGSARSNPNGSIHLHARSLEILHPISKEPLKCVAPLPKDALWDACSSD